MCNGSGELAVSLDCLQKDVLKVTGCWICVEGCFWTLLQRKEKSRVCWDKITFWNSISRRNVFCQLMFNVFEMAVKGFRHFRCRTNFNSLLSFTEIISANSEVIGKTFAFGIFIELLTSFLAVLKSAEQDWSLVRFSLAPFFRKFLLRIFNAYIIHGDFLFAIVL